MKLSPYLTPLRGLLLCLVLLPTATSGQTKVEREYRIKVADVPPVARQAVDTLLPSHRVRWYREEGLSSSSVEAKSRWQGQPISIEFDQSGELEDVELQISWQQLPEAARTTLGQYLDQSYQRYKLIKVQQQYSGSLSAISQHLLQEEAKPEVTIAYELVLRVKTTQRYKLMEYLVNNEGEVLRRDEIITRNTDNLEF